MSALAVLLVICACGGSHEPGTGTFVEPEPAVRFAGTESCRECHSREYALWRGSQHDLAMQVADESTVLGDFSGAGFSYFGAVSRFLRDGEAFVVSTEGADGENGDFPVRYTFGVYPLQQYLVEAVGGRLQALPFAWDSRPVEEGGGRWFHLYPDEPVRPGDALHWTGRAFNWNTMCAECHSTGVSVGYDPAADAFATRWAEPDVSCEACHGPGSGHVRQAQEGSFRGDSGFPVDLDDRGNALWRPNPVTGIAYRDPPALAPPRQPEACGRCHARRGVIAPDYEYGRPLEDTHRLALLDDGLYFADGQIRDEVYVYGSFVQSRMYQAGVVCSDCHEPHGLQLRTATGGASGVCAQCHLPARFADDTHDHHAGDDVSCVDCHMTARVYMGVDARRDHSFRVPRPDVSALAGAPNACNDCHTDQPVDWAVEAAQRWWGGGPARRPGFAAALHKGRNGHANGELLAVIDDSQFPAIARATALGLLSSSAGPDPTTSIVAALADADPLVRRAALGALPLLPPDLAVGRAAGLLGDPVRGVRIEAARALAPFRDRLRGSDGFQAAANEFRDVQRAALDRPESHVALGDFEAQLGDYGAARRHYSAALAMDPGSEAARVNFAEAMRLSGDEAGATRLLREGIETQPGSAALHHALGLSLVRALQREEGVMHLLEAARIAPDNRRYVYVAAVALNSTGHADEAVAMLAAARERFPGDFDVGRTLALILRDQGEDARAAAVAMELVDRFPDSPEAPALYRSLSGD